MKKPKGVSLCDQCVRACKQRFLAACLYYSPKPQKAYDDARQLERDKGDTCGSR